MLSSERISETGFSQFLSQVRAVGTEGAGGATREVAQVDVAVIDRAEEAVAVEVTVATPEAMGEARATHIS